MRKIKIENWKANVPVRNEEGKVVGSEEQDENLLVALNVLIASMRPEEQPRGLEKFKIFGKLAEAFEKAEQTKELELENREYEFLKNMLEKDMPSFWGMNKNLSKAITTFLETEEAK